MTQIAQSRDEARQLGVALYYGAPCEKPGHGNVRRAANKHCRQCGIEYEAEKRHNRSDAQQQAERERKRLAKAAGKWTRGDRAAEYAKRNADRADYWLTPEGLSHIAAKEAEQQRKREASDAARQEAIRQREIEAAIVEFMFDPVAYEAERRAKKRDHALRYRKAKKRNRMLREALAPGSHTEEQALAVMAAQGGCCAYCGSDGPLEKEHKIPLCPETKNGGVLVAGLIRIEGTNNIENIQYLCKLCNAEKHNKKDIPFRLLKGIPLITPWDAPQHRWFLSVCFGFPVGDISMSRPKSETRSAAKESKAARYQGRPCKHGHSGLRYTSTGACVECQADHQRKWIAEQREDSDEFAAMLG